MVNSEDRKTISIVKKRFEEFLKSPKDMFRQLLDDTVGRINIIVGERTFYLMTREKFDFFIKYELKKQQLTFKNQLDDCAKHKVESTVPVANKAHLTQAQKSLLQIKSRFELFKSLTDDDVIAIMDDIVVSQYQKGEKVFTVGTTEKDMYFIVRGEVSVFVGPGGDIKVATLKKAQFFGEMAYIMNEPRTATIKATSDIVLLLSFSVNTKVAKGVEGAYMKFYHNINKMLAQKLVMENRKK